MCVSIVDSDWSVLGFHINDFIRLYTLLNDYLEFLKFEMYAYMRSYTFINAYLEVLEISNILSYTNIYALKRFFEIS